MIPYSEDLFKYLDEAVDKAPIGLYLIDREGKLVCMNKRMPKILDCSEEIIADMIGQKVIELNAYKNSGLDMYIKRGLQGEEFSAELVFQAEVSGIKRRNHYIGEPIFENSQVKYVVLYVIPLSSEDIV